MARRRAGRHRVGQGRQRRASRDGRGFRVTTKPRILILGSTGQLGRELQRSFADAGEVVALGRATVDL
ncbi:MAG: sugar nucleotide-binding protein, partial [Acidobacteriota bacterium]|nr:sugar nucleotide-binding protein [Acidobacteriota bacterium]